MQQRRNNQDADRLLVRYDAARKLVTISFHGQVHVLPQTFPTYDDGMIAGYGFARDQGWHSP
jgi:hypothetical protein